MFAAVLLMTSVVMIQARSVTSQVGGIQQYLKVGVSYFSSCFKIRKINAEADGKLAQNTAPTGGQEVARGGTCPPWNLKKTM